MTGPVMKQRDRRSLEDRVSTLERWIWIVAGLLAANCTLDAIRALQDAGVL